MNLESKVTTLKGERRDLSLAERAVLACQLVREFEKVGEYDAAYEALTEFWPERNAHPELEGLDDALKAALLLRVGALAGWLGATDQSDGSQETAKNLITRSIEIFERLGDFTRAAEARADLALCYWREGAFDEARINLTQALSQLKNEDGDLKASVLIRAGIVEVDARRLSEALRLYDEAAGILKQSDDHALRGTFHNSFGLALRRLADIDNLESYLDRALIEYSAASFHFEQAGNIRYVAGVENNLGFLFFTIGKYQEAHKHLDRARRLFFHLSDAGMIAQVDETRARTLLAEGRLKEAEKFVRLAVKTLEKGDEHALLAEALTTHGVALARLGDYPSAKRSLLRAIEVAETAGDLEGAGRAKLSIIEELSGQTPAAQLVSIYQSAIELLKQSQDPTTNKRLIICSQKVIEAWKGGSIEDHVEGQEAKELSWASFKRQVRKAEKALISRALREGQGSVTKAAHLLGFKHHQSLISIINIRHGDLLKTRSRIRKRRRHIFSESRRPKKPAEKGIKKPTSTIKILHAEDDLTVAKLLGEMFAREEWRVDLCTDGGSALERLSGEHHYDLLLFDKDLPRLSGLELVLRARSLPNRRRTPIIMLSGEECETEAWRAGVNDFLRKPKDIDNVPLTIARLLNITLKNK